MRLFCLLLLPAVVSAFEYAMSDAGDDFGLGLTDVKTGITDVLTIFTNETTSVNVVGITWTEKENATAGFNRGRRNQSIKTRIEHYRRGSRTRWIHHHGRELI